MQLQKNHVLAVVQKIQLHLIDHEVVLTNLAHVVVVHRNIQTDLIVLHRNLIQEAEVELRTLENPDHAVEVDHDIQTDLEVVQQKVVLAAIVVQKSLNDLQVVRENQHRVVEVVPDIQIDHKVNLGNLHHEVVVIQVLNQILLLINVNGSY